MSNSQIQYVDRETREPTARTGFDPILSSATSGWNGITLEQFRLPAMEMPESSVEAHLLTLKLSEPSCLEWKSGSQYQGRTLLPGDVCLVPADSPRQLRWFDDVEVLALAVSTDILSRTLRDLKRPRDIELVESHGRDQSQVRHIALAMKAELEQGCPNGALFGDQLIAALCVSVVNAFGTDPRALKAPGNALMGSKLRLVLQYIDDHLDSDIPLSALADLVHLSPFHFSRQFKNATGVPPHAYLLHRRIERARPMLANGSLPIGVIAVNLGFSDQSHFTRHFKRHTGVSPRAFRQESFR